MNNLLKTLCELPGASGSEGAVREYIVKALEATPTKKEVTIDAMGNVICRLHGKKRASKTVMLTAHMDEIGLIVTSVTKDGFLRFETLGSIDTAVLYGKRVKIGDLTGVIGCKAVHLCTKDEKETLPKKENLVIDIGLSAQEAKHVVKPGDVAVFDAPFVSLQTLVMGKAIDDRVGCAMLLRLAQSQPTYDITLAFLVQEEIGCRGGGPAAFSVTPDIALIIETTTAADVADVPVEQQVCALGNGPVISFMDRTTLYDGRFYAQIRKIADENNIPNQTKTTVSGGNDAGNIQRSADGVLVATISVPCRYIHSPSTVCAMEDIENTEKLIRILVEVLPQ